MAQGVYKIKVFNLFDTGIYKYRAGQIFGVIENNSINFYSVIYPDNFTETTTIQSAIDNGYVKQVRSGEIEPTIRAYQPSESYHKDELFTDVSKSKMYIALQDFVATGNLQSDISSNYCKSFNETEYKQVVVSVNAGDIVSIQYDRPNYNLNRHVFIEQISPGESNKNIAFLTFYPGTADVAFDENWVNITDDGIGLKTDKVYNGTAQTNSTPITFYTTSFDINEFQEIGSITILAS